MNATRAQELIGVNELLRQARVLLLRADRARDLRTALLAVREALEITTRLSDELRGIAAAQDPTRTRRIASNALRVRR